MVVSLSACSTLPRPLPVMERPEAVLMLPCQRPGPLEGRTGSDLLSKLIETANLLDTCARAHDGLINAVETYINRP